MIIVPGNPDLFVFFNPARGVQELRPLAEQASREGFGIVITRNVGITSHICDILRINSVPSRIEQKPIHYVID